MIRQEEIAVVIDAQRETFLKQDSGFIRDALSEIPLVSSFATTVYLLGKKSTTLTPEYREMLRSYLRNTKKPYKDTNLYIRFLQEPIKFIFFMPAYASSELNGKGNE